MVQTRIKNPTCETCRWYRGLAGDESFTGECCLSPPELHYDQNGLSLPGLPEVNSDDFCSHHESAFLNPSNLNKPLGETRIL